MSPVVALSRIQELGPRGREDPAADPHAWSGMVVTSGGLRGLHEALHPTLLLLALAGYEVDDVFVGPPADGEILQVTLSPRDGGPFSWAEYIGAEVEPPWPSGAPFAVLLPLVPRPGLSGSPVEIAATGPLGPHVRDVVGRPFLAFDVDSAPNLAAIVSRLTVSQELVRTELAAAIEDAWLETNWDESTTGLLSALQPDLWTFPDLTDEEDLRRQAFRQVGDVFATEALAGGASLRAFLLAEAVVRDNEHPPSVRDGLQALAPASAADLERQWNAEACALWAQVHPEEEEERPPFRMADLRKLSFTELVFDLLNNGLVSLAGYDPLADTAAYGGFDLQRGDKDPAAGDAVWTYGGGPVPAPAGAPLPTYVGELRADLAQLGFGPLGDGDADRTIFGTYLESAVREFQVYASLGVVARFATPAELAAQVPVANPSLATRLLPQANDQAYFGPLCGVLNAETRALVKSWGERDWHCPVVVEARAFSNAQLVVLRDPASAADKAAVVTDRSIDDDHQNIWRRDQVTDAGLAFIAWDLTGHYPATASRPAGVPVTLAKYNPDSWGGPFAAAGTHTWPEAELTPASLFGANPDPSERPEQAAFWSTYRVIRAVSELECQGVVDGMNAYDSAILSGGPVHFTLGLAKKDSGKGMPNGPENCVIYPGELCPSLSLLAAEDPDEYWTYFGAFGLQPREPWTDPPTAMFSSGHRKYRGFILLQDAAGDYVDPRKENPATVDAGDLPVANPEDLLLIEVLHHWHWIYRWQMAPRLSRILRELGWTLARARVRALLGTPWGVIGGAPAGLTLGDVFTSEEAVAILERIHVWSPEKLFVVNDIGAEWEDKTSANIDLSVLEPAFEDARDVPTGGGTDPSQWGDDEEAALVTWLNANPLKDDIPTLVKWPIVAGDFSYTGRRHDLSVLPIAREEAPDIGEIAGIVTAPGVEGRVPVTVTDRETRPGGIEVDASSSDPTLLTASVEHAEGSVYNLVLEAPAGADGEVRLTVRARDGRQITEREVVVSVSAAGAPPQGQPAAYLRPDPIGLSRLRDSFELDGEGLFAPPA